VANVWRYPESQHRIACFRDEDGTQRGISTNETNSKKGLKIAEEFEHFMQLEYHGNESQAH
jgi:hypothetical protein